MPGDSATKSTGSKAISPALRAADGRGEDVLAAAEGPAADVIVTAATGWTDSGVTAVTE